MQTVELEKAIETIKDPLFRRDLRRLVEAMKIAGSFKRIDMSFLQMVRNGMPVFAILPYDLYRVEAECKWNGIVGNYVWHNSQGKEEFGFCGFAPSQRQIPHPPEEESISGRMDRRDVMRSFSNGVANLKCTPTKRVPETVSAKVDECRLAFDEVYVAWEAEWQTEQKDPLVIGLRAGFYFIIAKWDLSNMESYVAAEF